MGRPKSKPNEILHQDENDTFLIVESKTYGRLNFVVSTADYHLIKDHRWHVAWRTRGQCFYVVRNVTLPNGKRRVQRLHNVVMGHTPGKLTVDHINHDPLDNRRSNLRLASRTEQNINQRKQRNNTSGVRGVHFHAGRCRWIAQIRTGGKNKCIGYFKTIEKATAARQEAEITYFGKEVS